MVGLLLIAVASGLPASGQAPDATLAAINELRSDDELPPLATSAELDAVAAEHLASAIEARCLCPGTDATAAADLLGDVRQALGSDPALLDAGYVIGYGQTAEIAFRQAAYDPANAAAILGQRMTLAGVAAEAIPAGAGWLVTPPGGTGPEIDLGGFTVIVIVTAGAGP